MNSLNQIKRTEIIGFKSLNNLIGQGNGFVNEITAMLRNTNPLLIREIKLLAVKNLSESEDSIFKQIYRGILIAGCRREINMQIAEHEKMLTPLIEPHALEFEKSYLLSHSNGVEALNAFFHPLGQTDGEFNDIDKNNPQLLINKRKYNKMLKIFMPWLRKSSKDYKSIKPLRNKLEKCFSISNKDEREEKKDWSLIEKRVLDVLCLDKEQIFLNAENVQKYLVSYENKKEIIKKEIAETPEFQMLLSIKLQNCN